MPDINPVYFSNLPPRRSRNQDMITQLQGSSTNGMITQRGTALPMLAHTQQPFERSRYYLRSEFIVLN